jgi:hypothetical protein
VNRPHINVANKAMSIARYTQMTVINSRFGNTRPFKVKKVITVTINSPSVAYSGA